MLQEFITAHRAEIIARARVKVTLRTAPGPEPLELESGVPLFMDQLATALGGQQASVQNLQAIGATAAVHAGHLLHQGFTISQVVHTYGDGCQALIELAQEDDVAITSEELQTMNRCLEDATAEAVTEYTRLRDVTITNESNLRAGVLAHELRNRLTAASIGFELIKRGTAPPSGGTSSLVSRSHAQMGVLIHRSLIQVRLKAGNEYRERVLLATLIAEAEMDGALEADRRQHAFTVAPVDKSVELDVDRQVVAGAIANLVQNACKFTEPGGLICLRTSATERRVRIEVEDQCGGLPPGKVDDFFAPYQQRGENRTGMGLGLYISRKGIEANDGILEVADLPGQGCIFSIDLPRTNDDPASASNRISRSPAARR